MTTFRFPEGAVTHDPLYDTVAVERQGYCRRELSPKGLLPLTEQKARELYEDIAALTPIPQVDLVGGNDGASAPVRRRNEK